MDSCVTTAIASLDHRLAMLHVAYGQRTEGRELKSFNALADFYKAECRLVSRLEHLQQIGGSSLTDPSIEVERANLERKDIPSSYVPKCSARKRFLSAPSRRIAPATPTAGPNTTRRSTASSSPGLGPRPSLKS